MEELREQVDNLRSEYYMRTTGSNWLKESPMMKYALAKLDQEQLD